jgi:hypothetical protein
MHVMSPFHYLDIALLTELKFDLSDNQSFLILILSLEVPHRILVVIAYVLSRMADPFFL